MTTQWEAGKLLQDARERQALSRAEAARRADVSESWWAKTEKGFFRQHGEDLTYRPTATLLSRAAQAVGLAPSQILYIGEYPGYESAPDDRGALSGLINQIPSELLPIARAYLEGLLQAYQAPRGR